MKIEIAANSLASALAAFRAGADRIELCSNLELGGTTPGPGTLIASREKLSIPIHVLVRPRAGDFVYQSSEIEEMKRTIQFCREIKIEGIVMGFLTPEGKVDRELTLQMADHAEGMDLTFHRAFDQVLDQEEALETIIELGFDRILTSGGMPTVPEGIRQIANLIRQADERIIIMPGGGINNFNFKDVVEHTGAREFHMSAKKVIKSPVEFRPRRDLINAQDIHPYNYILSNEEKIRNVTEQLKELEK